MTEPTVDEKRTKILQRILNLRAKAEDDGASEAEMNTALIMCEKLMNSYGVAEAELALAEAKGEIKLEIVQKKVSVSAKKTKGGTQKHKITFVLGAIAAFTETKVVFWSHNGDIEYTGHKPDVEVAEYITAMVKEALDREFDHWRLAQAGATGYGAKSSFQGAMASRVSSRLYAMARERRDERERAAQEARVKIEHNEISSSTALVLADVAAAKAKLVNETFTKAHSRLRTVSTSFTARNGTAFGAGRAAGDRVSFNKGLGGGQLRLTAN